MYPRVLFDPIVSIPVSEPAPLTVDPHTPPQPATLFFVGDIMLGRAVETQIEEYGIDYPFLGTKHLISDSDVSVGNFEGVVSDPHVHTPIFTYQFSINPLYLHHLSDVGFDVLSLANNHSFDYGTTSLSETRAMCHASLLLCLGSPHGVDAYSTHVVRVKDRNVGFIFLDTISSSIDTTQVVEALVTLARDSDVQIAYVHWGDEYAITHNGTQENLAQVLIDAGADAVFGHHPHVAQDIKIYNDKPIFYSLGNFVFDQYFSDDVQEMYGVRMEVRETDVLYTLVPMSSTETRGQPHPMVEEKRIQMLARILQPISKLYGVDVRHGTIITPY
jgi:poly-gamma-glutamate capsule biosynthesis protein CapA/YwtB (metallophosphatase superfamily)